MFGEEKLLMTIQMNHLEERDKIQEITDWGILIRLLIQPTFFRPFHEATESFHLKKFQLALELAVENEQIFFVVGNEENECSFHYENQQLLIKNVIDKQVFNEKEALIHDYLRMKMATHGVFAYLRAYSEFLAHNTKEIERRTLFETQEEIGSLPKMKGQEGEVIVDCNHFAGYDLFYRGLCLTSCWEMYYSAAYFKVIPKPIFLDVQQVENITELENQVLKIQLYKNPFNWRKKENLRFQAYYRDQLGFDHLAWDNGVGLLKEPFIEYAYTDRVIQSVQYQNQNMQPVPKKAATFFVTRSYDIEQNQYRERRVKGALNAQAYFPWVDENRAQMMCYKMIDPTVAMDEGIQAYCYYIREYLEVEVQDEKYQDYQVVLRLYVPPEALANLPIAEMKQQLTDIQISRQKKKKGTIFFDLKKGDNHLRVVFLDYRKLEALTTIQRA